jgi:hypothetical protein
VSSSKIQARHLLKEVEEGSIRSCVSFLGCDLQAKPSEKMWSHSLKNISFLCRFERQSQEFVHTPLKSKGNQLCHLKVVPTVPFWEIN